MSSIKTLSCPFEGEYFQNRQCLRCNIKPSDLYVIADGIVCPKCRNNKVIPVGDNGKIRYLDLNQSTEEFMDYTKEIESYIDGIN